MDASHSQSHIEGVKAIKPEGLLGFVPIPKIQSIVMDAVKDVLASSTVNATPRQITPMDAGIVCHVSLVKDVAKRLHERISSTLLATGDVPSSTSRT
jgi:hypothetical protein